jgi:hypothetical protein
MRTGVAAACGIAGTEARVPLGSEPCRSVSLADPVPAYGITGRSREICGEAGVFEFLVERSCPAPP